MPSKSRADKLAGLAHERAAIVAGTDDGTEAQGTPPPASPGSARLWAEWSPHGRNVFAGPDGGNDYFLTRVARGTGDRYRVPPLEKLPRGEEARRLREYVGVSVGKMAHAARTVPDAIEAYERTGKLPKHVAGSKDGDPLVSDIIDVAAYRNLLSACLVCRTARKGAPWPEPAPKPPAAVRPEPTVMFREAYSDELAHFTKIHAVARGDVDAPRLSNVPPPESLLRLYEAVWQKCLPPGNLRTSPPRDLAEKGIARIVGGQGWLDLYWEIHGWPATVGAIQAPHSVLRVLGVLWCWAEEHADEIEAAKRARAERLAEAYDSQLTSAANTKDGE